MSALASPDLDLDLTTDALVVQPWQVVVWDDPINLMNYVVRVFRDHFGYSTERATQHMMQVHTDGHSVLAEGPREQMEMHAVAMHSYGLQATIRRAPAA